MGLVGISALPALLDKAPSTLLDGTIQSYTQKTMRRLYESRAVSLLLIRCDGSSLTSVIFDRNETVTKSWWRG
jgi:hypothetical protein